MSQSKRKQGIIQTLEKQNSLLLAELDKQKRKLGGALGEREGRREVIRRDKGSNKKEGGRKCNQPSSAEKTISPEQNKARSRQAGSTSKKQSLQLGQRDDYSSRALKQQLLRAEGELQVKNKLLKMQKLQFEREVSMLLKENESQNRRFGSEFQRQREQYMLEKKALQKQLQEVVSTMRVQHLGNLEQMDATICKLQARVKELSQQNDVLGKELRHVKEQLEASSRTIEQLEKLLVLREQQVKDEEEASRRTQEKLFEEIRQLESRNLILKSEESKARQEHYLKQCSLREQVSALERDHATISILLKQRQLSLANEADRNAALREEGRVLQESLASKEQLLAQCEREGIERLQSALREIRAREKETAVAQCEAEQRVKRLAFQKQTEVSRLLQRIGALQQYYEECQEQQIRTFKSEMETALNEAALKIANMEAREQGYRQEISGLKGRQAEQLRAVSDRVQAEMDVLQAEFARQTQDILARERRLVLERQTLLQQLDQLKLRSRRG